MNTSAQNIQYLIKDEIVEAGIVEENGQTMVYSHSGREYLISIVAIDITGWQKER